MREGGVWEGMGAFGGFWGEEREACIEGIRMAS